MDELCEICGLNEGQDHTPCFEVKDLTSHLAEAHEKIVEIDTDNGELKRKLKEAREQLEICQRLSDTFWDALKPLGLKEIYLSCPGQHVADLIMERDKAREEIARLRKALEAIKHRHVPMTSRDEYRRGYTDALSIVQLIAKEVLEASDG